MSSDPVLLIGGAGTVGRFAARYLREENPDLPLLIGGRDAEKAASLAAELGNAEGVALDLSLDDLGLGERPVAAVAVFFMDNRVAGLRFAQTRGVAYVNIAVLLHEMSLEVAAQMQKPDAAPVVLGTEWLVGATSVPALHLAKAFAELDAIAIGALLDDEDAGGPAQTADLERITKAPPPVLARRDGEYVWLSDEEMKSSFRAVDGTEMDALGLSPNDVVALAAATGAPTIRFDLATGVSSSRRRGGAMSTEIVIELSGMGHDGRPLRTRHAVVHPQGQMPPTGLGVALVVEALLGLHGNPPPPAGLYFPSQILEPDVYMARLKKIGGEILDLSND